MAYKPVKKAVFPVAGLGTRFLPATKVMPKEMLPINDRPLIQHVFEEAREAGIEEFIFVTGRYKEMLEQHFDFQPELEDVLESRNKQDMLEKVRDSEIPAGKLFLTRQPRPLGLGHAVWCAKKLVGDDPFAVLLPDDIVRHGTGCLKQMVEAYEQHGGNIVAVRDVPKADTSKYGILDIASDDGKNVKVKGLVEKPAPEKAPSTLSIIGRYILQPEVFEHLSAFETGAGGEIQLTDAMAKLIGKQPFHGLRFDGQHYDCGSRLGFIEANIAYMMNDKGIGAQVRKVVKAYAAQEK
ncbi:MAG TPA: UTP--glucose-1-phosphate uridylyltransferase GalU [Alphaproteobacteria bacterium]|jgi:UTP--glucose-1-phosphate uridylyltransferase|nr:UTP--glucose-1-phosphate uridylyltransferase GalU [Micavibrio sp.]MBK9561696.1 UTP--glucose-1-phosphate uridylyltransferase GalU [Micavibrio sp.]HQX27789.1 UTP--glucose-1-phosphate uridylyltransferase GalU [Alphaproteobacteria bacterium]